MKRCALIDDRHQRQPEVDDAHTSGEECLEGALREKVDLRREALSDSAIHAVRKTIGEPVHQRKPRVHFDREATVRSRDEHPAAYADRLRHQLLLPLAILFFVFVIIWAVPVSTSAPAEI